MNNGDPSKRELYGEYLRGEKWERKLKAKATHKALDIALDEPLDIDINKSAGIGAGGAIGVALAAGVPTAIIALAMLFKGGSSPTVPTAGPADSNYTVRFFDKDGAPINVPHISARPTQANP